MKPQGGLGASERGGPGPLFPGCLAWELLWTPPTIWFLVEEAADGDSVGGLRMWGFLELQPTKQESWGAQVQRGELASKGVA